MPAESTIPERQHRGLGLIETMLWQCDKGIALLSLHLERLSRSVAVLNFSNDVDAIRRRLERAGEGTSEDRLRVRLVAFADGSFEVARSPEPVLPPGTVWTVVISEAMLDPMDPLIGHKTTQRAHYDAARAAAKADYGADETIFLNSSGEVCEGSITSVFVPRGDVLLTPDLACGLLPGVLRESLLRSGKAREARLRPLDLSDGFFLGNAVRGLVAGRLL